MTMLTSIKDACSEIGLTAPLAVASGQSLLARQLFAIAKAELEDLSRTYDWPDLVLAYTFDTAAATEDYALPAGFDKLVSDTVYRANDYWKARGSLSPSQWEFRKNSNFGQLSRTGFRLYKLAGNMRLDPVPTAVDTYVYEYKSSLKAIQADETKIDTFLLDTDAPIVPEGIFQMGLKWRILRSKGAEFTTERNDYIDARAQAFAQQMSAPDLPIGSDKYSLDWPITNGFVPDNGFGA
jgi:hypothetical protein